MNKATIFIVVVFASCIPVRTHAADIKRIDVDLSEQRLRYYLNDVKVNEILVSTGTKYYPSPKGTYPITTKRPVVRYLGHNLNGTIYDYPKTKWNLEFLPHYYIHGAYWHHNFGRPMSHGCINVSYADMEQLYNFADVGTSVTIHE